MSVQISYAPLDHSSGVMAWLGAGEEEQGKQGTITSPPNFRLSKKFLSDNFISKIQNLRPVSYTHLTLPTILRV